MPKTRKILLLPGDGIGPEVIGEVRKILDWMNKTKSLDFVLSQELIGGASIDANKVPITDEVFYKSLESDAVILGACGGPKWDNLEFSKKIMLLEIRLLRIYPFMRMLRMIGGLRCLHFLMVPHLQT